MKQEARNTQTPDRETQMLRQCLRLLEASIERYDYLKQSGASDVVLFTEEGLIDQQLLFLSKIQARLTK